MHTGLLAVCAKKILCLYTSLTLSTSFQEKQKKVSQSKWYNTVPIQPVSNRGNFPANHRVGQRRGVGVILPWRKVCICLADDLKYQQSFSIFYISMTPRAGTGRNFWANQTWLSVSKVHLFFRLEEGIQMPHIRMKELINMLSSFQISARL